MQRIAIIGAGPAGLMSLATILEGRKNQNFHIDIFEKNTKPGKKLLLSGGGRCNVTTGTFEKQILATKYTRGWDFFRKSLGKFGPKKVYEWFENHNLSLKIESDGRVFPQSDQGNDVLAVFENIIANHRDIVTLHYGEGVLDLQKESSGYHLSTKNGDFYYDVAVIATGGNAYAHTGSTGDGYSLAKGLGHTITQLGPSLSSFLTHEAWIHALSGVSFDDAVITFSGKEIQGPILLTHFGISGPLAFMLSSHLAWETINTTQSKTILWKPLANMNDRDWSKFLSENFQLHPKKSLFSILSTVLPKRFSEIFIQEFVLHIRDIHVTSIKKEDREYIAKLLGKGIPLTLIGRRPGDEFVTAGGVNTDEVHTQTLESKVHNNLYFTGEVLNIDGYTGGYSLQICWSTGYTVGQSIIKK